MRRTVNGSTRVRRTRVLVADPLRLFRVGVRNVLDRESDLDVVEAADAGEVERVVAGGGVDIALVDLDLPPAGGLTLICRLRAVRPTHVIVWSFQPTREAVLAAITAGAHGFLHKAISPQGLVRALRGAVNGEAPLSRDMAGLMIDAIHALETKSQALERAAVLSEREKEVLALVSAGARNRDIAAELGISEFTVKRHVQNILHKLELPSRRAAGAFYRAAYRREASA